MVNYKRIKNTIRGIILFVIVLYFGLMAALSVPFIQKRISTFVSKELSQKIGAKVSIERVYLGLFNRIIVQNAQIDDRQGKPMLRVSRLSAKIDVLALLENKIRINSTQLFGANALLYRQRPDSAMNCQFVIDAFSSEKKKEPSLIDLRINTILIRRGQVKYDLLSAPERPEQLDVNHLHVKQISATIALKVLTNDSINLNIKRFGLTEKSGFQLQKLSLRAEGNRKGLKVNDFYIGLPHSEMHIDSLTTTYRLDAPKSDFLKGLTYDAELRARLTLDDLRAFVPQFKDITSPISCSMYINGKSRQLSVDRLKIENEMRGMFVDAYGIVDGDLPGNKPYFFVKINRAQLKRHATQSIYRSLSQKNDTLGLLNRIGDLTFMGDVSGYPNQLTTHGTLNAAVGSLSANVTMHKDARTHQTQFSGTLESKGLHVGRTIGDARFGAASFNLELKGFTYRNNQPQSHIKGTIASVEYNQYEYKNITLDGETKPGGFNGRIALDDPNGKVEINGQFITSKQTPDFNLSVKARRINPHQLHLTDKWQNANVSFDLIADFSGQSIDDMAGKIVLDSLEISSPEPEKQFQLERFSIEAGKGSDARKHLVVASSFLNGEIVGNYSYKTIANSLVHTAQRYFPSVFGKWHDRFHTTNNFTFHFSMTHTDLWEKMFGLPLRLESEATLNGSFDDAAQHLQANGYLPSFIYNGTRYESGALLCKSVNDEVSLSLRTNMMMKKGAMVMLALNANGKNDHLHTTLNWGNNTSVTYSGKIDAHTHFNRDETTKDLRTKINIMPSEIVLNDSVWNIHPSEILINRETVSVDRFLFEHNDQHLQINGNIGATNNDSCIFDLKGIDIDYVMNMVKFNAVSFEGKANGHIVVKGGLKQPDIHARLLVDNFTFNRALLGQADIDARWDNEIGGFRLKAHMDDSPYHYLTDVDGYVSPKQNALDLHIHANGTNIALVQPFVKSIFRNIDGRGYGKVRLFGKFSELDLEGQVRAEADAHVNILQTDFSVASDSIVFAPGSIRFYDVAMRDHEGNSGTAYGEITHEKLKKMRCTFRFNAQRMLVYNAAAASVDFPFYGKIFGTGNIVLRAFDNQLLLDGNLRAEENTSFTYVLGGVAQATNNGFITFIDKTPVPQRDLVQTQLYHYLNANTDEKEQSSDTDVHINLQIEPTQAANMRIIMDPIAGDNISGTGTGNLHVTYFNKGKFEIFGTYQISQGVYKMSLQNVIRKDFTLQPGGMVSFNGDPTKAQMNVQAIYTVNSASLSDLIANGTTNQNTVRVNCLLNLTGNITSPELSFDLELPTVNDEDRQLVKSLTSTKEQMNTQIIYLLGLGKFYPYDVNTAASQSNAGTSLAFNTLSGQLNDILTSAIDNQNWNFGTNFSTGERGWNDMEAQAILSGRLLNNRLLINGNFGYKENYLKNTNFVGDFEAIWLLTPSGDFRIRGYNQTNDRYFTKSTLTTQGIGLMYKKDFTNWKDLLNLFSKKNRTEPTKK